MLLRDILFSDFTRDYKAGLEALLRAVRQPELYPAEKEATYGPAPFLLLPDIVSNEALMLVLARDPECRQLPEKMCAAVFNEVLRSTKAAVLELCHVSNEYVKITDYINRLPSLTLGIVNVIKFPRVIVHQHAAYGNYLDEVHVSHSFCAALGHLVHRIGKMREAVQARRLYMLPEAVSWGADGGYPDGMDGGQTIELIGKEGLFPNREKWEKTPPDIGWDALG